MNEVREEEAQSKDTVETRRCRCRKGRSKTVSDKHQRQIMCAGRRQYRKKHMKILDAKAAMEIEAHHDRAGMPDDRPTLPELVVQRQNRKRSVTVPKAGLAL